MCSFYPYKKDSFWNFGTTPHCLKSVRNRSCSGPDFPALGLNTERYFRISPYSVRMGENADQNNLEYGHFLRSALDQ